MTAARSRRVAVSCAVAALTFAAPAWAQTASDSLARATSLHGAPSEETLASLRRTFKYQTVARVYVGGRRYLVQSPKITPAGFAHGRVIEPDHVPKDELPATIPWSDVDSLLLRRTHATRMGTAFALTFGVLAGLAGHAVVTMEEPNPGALAYIVFGAAGAGAGYLAGGFLGGFVQYWVQVYPERTPDPDWRRRQRPGA